MPQHQDHPILDNILLKEAGPQTPSMAPAASNGCGHLGIHNQVVICKDEGNGRLCARFHDGPLCRVLRIEMRWKTATCVITTIHAARPCPHATNSPFFHLLKGHHHTLPHKASLLVRKGCVRTKNPGPNLYCCLQNNWGAWNHKQVLLPRLESTRLWRPWFTEPSLTLHNESLARGLIKQFPRHSQRKRKSRGQSTTWMAVFCCNFCCEMGGH